MPTEQAQQAQDAATDLQPGEFGDGAPIDDGATITPDPETGDTAKEPELTEAEKHQKEVNKQHFKFQEEKRGRLKTQQDLDAANAKIAEFEKAQPVPVVPPVPDSYDDNYVALMAARDKAIQDQATYNNNQIVATQSIQNAEAERQKAAQEIINQNVADYGTRSVALGLDQAEMAKKETALVGSGLDGEVAGYILIDKNGPLIVKYLAENPLELDAITQMTPLAAAVHISTEITPKAAQYKPKQSDAPDPLKLPDGSGTMPDQENPLIKGVIYE